MAGILNKFRKKVEKKFDDVIVDLEEPKIWLHSGNYVLNHILSGYFSKGYPAGRIVQLFGDSGCLIPDEKIRVYKIEDEKSIDKIDEQKSEILSIEIVYNRYMNGDKFMVDTPDGFQYASKFIKKDKRKCYHLKTENFSIKCSHDHLIETNMGWIKTEDLTTKHKILTKNGFEILEIKDEIGDFDVYDMTIEHDNHRYWGGSGISSHNSGKSFLVATSIKAAQQMGYTTVILDSEQAMSKDYLNNIGVDTDADNLMTLQVSTVEQAQNLMVDLLTDVIDAQKAEGKDAVKLLLIVDSLGQLMSKKALEDSESLKEGGMDMGIKAKALKKMFLAVTQKVGLSDSIMIVTNHMTQTVGTLFPQNIPVGGKCLTAKTGIITENGIKNIEDIVIGDKVKTHLGEYKEVTRLFEHDDLDVYEIELENGQKIRMTSDHEMLVFRDNNLQWIQCKDLKESDSFVSLRD